MNVTTRGIENYGGLARIFIARLADVAEHLTDGRLISSHALAYFEELPLIKSTGNLDSQEVSSSSGTFYRHKVSGRVAKIDLTHNLLLQRWSFRELMLLTVDHNGLKQQLGEPEFPFRLITNKLTGQEVRQLNHYAVQLEGVTLLDYLPYTDLLPGEVIPEPPMALEFHPAEFNATEFY